MLLKFVKEFCKSLDLASIRHLITHEHGGGNVVGLFTWSGLRGLVGRGGRQGSKRGSVCFKFSKRVKSGSICLQISKMG